jgi:PIN domain associated with the TPR-GreAB-C-PIN system
MDPILTKLGLSLTGKICELALPSLLAARKEKKETDAIQKSLADSVTRGFERFAKKYGNLSNSLFDERFLENNVATEFSKLLTRSGRPDAILIEKKYRAQFTTSLPSNLNQAIRDFLYFIEDEMKKEEALQSIIDSRQIEAIHEKLIGFDEDWKAIRRSGDINFPTEIVDQTIDKEIKILRQSRFFSEYDRINCSIVLGRRLSEGDLCRGTDTVREMALAWCARVLSITDEFSKAENFLNLAKSLGGCPEIEIAKAFFFAKDGNKGEALKTLGEIDSEVSRSAALMIVMHLDGGEQAINWLNEANIGASDLDSEGKFNLLQQLLMLSMWDEAKKALSALNDCDFEETPALNHMTAITQLLQVVPVEFRSLVLYQVPFDAAIFPLAEDADAMEIRKIAQLYFRKAIIAAQSLSLQKTAKIYEEYSLWLELMDPEKAASGKQILEEKFRDTKFSLNLIPLGLQFRIKLNIEAVEKEINRQITLNGGGNYDTAKALFALALSQKTPKNVAEYIDAHYAELSKHLDPKAIQFLQIDMLSRAGLREKANELLESLLKNGLSASEEGRLRNILAEAEGNDTVEARKTQFKQTKVLGDLIALIEELERRKDWNSLYEYSLILFKETRTINDAVRVINALHNSQQSERLIDFFADNQKILSQSQKLQIPYAWALYDQGDFIQARAVLAKLSDEQENPSYRSLEINLGIAFGDWNSLLTVVAKEYTNREIRSAHDLIGAAQLALHLGSPHAKALVYEAATKAGDDASILAAAYFLASSAGWANDEEVFSWLNRAAELSGEDGPIQKMTMKDILDRKPDWDQRESETWQLLSRGEIPIFLAAQSLNKNLADLILIPAYTNLSERDPRRRGIIPIYSGKHPQALLRLAGTKIGIDAIAFFTLSYLNILESTLDAFDEIYIPHSTLTWLFEEKNQAAFHQPSRIRDAHRLGNMLVGGKLQKLNASTVEDSELSEQVGNELALLIAEAEKDREEDDRQHIVIRSSPVLRITSLLQEEADLSCHIAVIGSCLSVVEKLQEKGQITSEEGKRAQAYLRLQEKPWAEQPEIKDGAVLYLDGLSIIYFQHIGILEKLQPAGFVPIISNEKITETNSLITYEAVSDRTIEAIESVRAAVHSRIESGKIKIGKKNQTLEGKKAISTPEHPSIDIIAFSNVCNAVISDDRFLNQHAHIDNDGVKAPIFTTLDLLNTLASDGVISIKEKFEYKTLLRRGGYVFIPVEEDELSEYLKATAAKNDKLVETAELKAIRENILRVRMSTWLQLPKEALWLDTIFKVFIKVLKNLWTDDTDLVTIKMRSGWIIDQVDIRGWAHRYEKEIGDNIIKKGRGALIHILLSPPLDAKKSMQNEYCLWIEDRILASVKEQFPELYALMINLQKSWIAELRKNQNE